MRRVVLVSVVVGLAVVAAAQASPTSDVASVLLKPSQVGSGYVLRKAPGWNQVKSQVTLDLCGDQFASEALRLAREQVAYTGTGKSPLSNEVVAYKSGGAVQALSEVRHAIATCPAGWTGSRLQAVAREKSAITVFHPDGLLPGSIAFVQHLSMQARNSSKIVSFTGVIVFQQRKDVLSGVYTYNVASRSLALHAAAQAKQNLLGL